MHFHEIVQRGFRLAIAVLLLGAGAASAAESGPVRVLFLGHAQEHHNSDDYYPLLAQGLGREAIYFDYVTTVEEALGDAEYLDRFDAVLLYANHAEIAPHQWRNLLEFVERKGRGFVPVHCASWCFQNEPGFDPLVGGRFLEHKTAVFSPRTVRPEHPVMRDVPAFTAWDETYKHNRHNEKNRTVLQVRVPEGDDNITEPEPWTWVRTQGKGRIFYTASGHDERVWGQPGFQELLKKGILWAIGDRRRAAYEQFLANRAPLEYEKRDNIPNYEKRPEPLLYQRPLPAEESMKYTQAPAEFRLELFAAEPQIVNPIAMAWDERGRLWVAESVDYPNELKEDRKGNDSIKILEDTDGDGRCDQVTVFADGLNIPTSLTFSRGGVIVAHAPDFLFLKDTDGDDRADVREVLFSGWGIRDTHAGPSNLRHGFDNWIWGTVGYSRFRGELGGRQHNFGMGVFRFQPDGSAIEFLHQFNNNTWGLGFNSAGDVFGSTANNNPSFFCGIPETIYGARKRMSAKMVASSPAFHPITPNIRQVDVFGGYTAGCGHALATSAAFPEAWRDEVAFVCGPTGNLVGKFRMLPDGSGYRGQNDFTFLASADEWFSPVAAEVGPDGHLWVADWYNFIIQHNPTPSPERGGYRAETGEGNAHVNPNRDRQHGRIYRVVRNQAPRSGIGSLAGASGSELAGALESDNLFWRQTAQRLLVDGDRQDAAPALRKLAGGKAPAAVHALWALRGLGQLDEATHKAALIHPDSALRKNAIRALGVDTPSTQMLYDSAVLADKDPQVRREAFVKLAMLPAGEIRNRTAAKLLEMKENADDEWLSLALKAAGAGEGGTQGFAAGPNLLPNPSFEDTDGGRPAGWTFRNYSGDANKVDWQLESRPDYVRSGRHSLKIRATAGADTSLFARVELKPETEYRLAGWIRTEDIKGARGAQLNVHELQRRALTQGLSGNTGWTGVQARFRTDSRSGFSVNALLGGWGQSTGSAWFDDLELVEMIATRGGGDAGPFVGEAARGRKIFKEHPFAACSRCHALEGEGGVVGPALDGIALRKERDYILESLVEPAATLAEGFDKLGASPMPPMNIILDDQEMADVMAFLMTLKTPVQPGAKPAQPKTTGPSFE